MEAIRLFVRLPKDTSMGVLMAKLGQPRLQSDFVRVGVNNCALRQATNSAVLMLPKYRLTMRQALTTVQLYIYPHEAAYAALAEAPASLRAALAGAMAEVGLSLAVTAEDATVGFEGKPPRAPQVAVSDQLVDELHALDFAATLAESPLTDRTSVAS